ncbi:MAG: M23 family metallopeptidase [Desulfobacteraceae bacterium]|nr:M23 family metallopeptidase [Desulfobacteraceae bacterium]
MAPLLSTLPPGGEVLELACKLQRGETLAAALSRLRLADNLKKQITKGFRGALDLRKLQPGDTLSIRQGPDGSLAGCTYDRGPYESYTFVESASGWRAVKSRPHFVCRTVKVTGTVGDGPLSEAFLAAGEGEKLASAFADIFASVIDFDTKAGEGDRFSLLVEKYYEEGRFVRYGHILAGRYQPAAGKILEAIYYQSGERSGYFRPDGRSLGISFIRSPVPLARVSSVFTDRRRHPLLGIIRPHLGIDLAAPVGTPVMAAADGRVRFIGYNGGFGKQIVIEHAGGYRTHYGHLSRFRRGLRVGDQVRQKEIIGYVGATGLATGPHLDYRLDRFGKFLDPSAAQFLPIKQLAGDQLAQLRNQAIIYHTFMEENSPSPFLASRDLTPSTAYHTFMEENSPSLLLASRDLTPSPTTPALSFNIPLNP